MPSQDSPQSEIARRCVYTLALSAAIVIVTAMTALARPPAVGGAIAGTQAWTSYKTRFVKQDGRVVDTGNGGISHSEGQGYAMLLAVAASDRPAFDRMWAWTRKNLYIRRDGLAAWKWSAGKGAITDRNNASDGDILIAWALAEAAAHWNSPRYHESALRIARAVRMRLVRFDVRHGNFLLPGARGFDSHERLDGPVVNLSYWVYPAMERFAQIDAGFDWRKLARNGVRMTREAGFGASGLPVEWTSLALDTPTAAYGFPATFGYNAVRIPLYLAWSSNPARPDLKAFATAWRKERNRPGTGNELLEKFAAAQASEPGYAAIFALARCAGSGGAMPDSFYRPGRNRHYYSATLHMLAIIAAASTRPACLDTARTGQILASGWQAQPFAPAVAVAARTAPENSADNSAQKQLSRSPASFEVVARIGEAGQPKSAPRTSPPAARAGFDWLPSASSGNPMMPLLLVPLTLLILLSASAGLRAAIAHWRSRKTGQDSAEPKKVPRQLSNVDFEPVTDAGAFNRNVKRAAEASVEHDRTLGMIYVPISAYWDVRATRGDGAADRMMEIVADALRYQLRGGDTVFLNGRDEIVISVPLLRCQQDLKSIARRLRVALYRLGLKEEPLAAVESGTAIYPLHGYDAMEMIETARFNYGREIKKMRYAAPKDAGTKLSSIPAAVQPLLTTDAAGAAALAAGRKPARPRRDILNLQTASASPAASPDPDAIPDVGGRIAHLYTN